MEPTAKNILNILSCMESNRDETITFGFLKRYKFSAIHFYSYICIQKLFFLRFIKEASDDIRQKCLRFSTGADVITDNKIKVEFTNCTGLASTPVSHTCTGVLQLPSRYEYFSDFRKEFNSLLSSNIWVMDII